MERNLGRTIGALVCCALVVFIVLCGVLACAVIDVNTRLAETFGKLNDTIAQVDTASATWAKASTQQVNSVSAIERDIRAELWHVDRTLLTADDTLKATTEAVGHVGPLLDSTKATTEAATGALQATQQTVAQANERIAQLQAPIAQLNAFIAHSDALVTDPAVKGLLTHAAGTASHVDAITLDFQKVADKTTADYLKPVPWYMWPAKRSGQLMDLGAFAARHAP